ncbi:MAG: hypothetical protein IOC56_02140 [Methylobacterium sp.]|nr:hypothetical protein [Methylobacterium sp.]MCA3619875.1 hypothetical protein [Methylobacterium sp.]
MTDLDRTCVAPPINDRLIRHFLAVALRFWSCSTRRIAWILTIAFMLGLLANMLLALAINVWTKFFFDALQHRDEAGLIRSILLMVIISLGASVSALALLQARMRLQLRWRAFLTTVLIANWLGGRKDALPETPEPPEPLDNPEARIAEDARLSIEILVDLAGGVINTMLALSSFTLVLWYVGGSITVHGTTIPGYLVLVVVIYTSLTAYGMYALSWPLVARIEDKAKGEGNLRYALTEARQNVGPAQSIEVEIETLGLSFGALAKLWIALIGRQAKMSFFSSGTSVFSVGLPLLLCAPKFLSGEMTLGDLMQASAAFVQVHAALNWPADNALSLASWAASARRVAALDLACRPSG